MSDIVERLRWPGSRTSWESADQQCNEAADEIERLRAEVEALRAALRTVAVVGYQMGVGTWCRVCHEWWLTAAPEAHKPGCLAAPKEGE